LPKYSAETKPADESVKTVVFTVGRFLDSTDRNIVGVTKPLAKDTHDHYKVLLNRRLLPYCAKHGITSITEFEKKDVCRLFVEEWRQLRRNIGAPLDTKTKATERARFSAFLNFCEENGWIKINGVKHLPVGKTIKLADTDDDGDDEETEGGIRYGLDIHEYVQLLDAPDSPYLTALQNLETRIAIELAGPHGIGARISDVHKFSTKDIVPNETGNGWNAHFKQKKNGRWCTSPISDDLVAKLKALPDRRIERGRKYFFSCSYSALRERIMARAKRAQADKPFTIDASGKAKHFSPHCLRHTFAIHHLYELDRDVAVVSKWLGHKSQSVTIKYYGNWIKGTHMMSEVLSREGNIKTQQMIAAIRTAALSQVA